VKTKEIETLASLGEMPGGPGHLSPGLPQIPA
jgi:hypothetical protein